MRKPHLDRRLLTPTNNSKYHYSPGQAHQSQISQAESAILWLEATMAFPANPRPRDSHKRLPTPIGALPTKHRVVSRLVTEMKED
jgi:hypothetical protein